jgi:hypothetical protein
MIVQNNSTNSFTTSSSSNNYTLSHDKSTDHTQNTINNNNSLNTNNFINNSPSSNTHIGSKLPNTWRICTTNIRGLNTPGKNTQATELFNDLNIDILILTETKLNNNNAKFCFTHSNHTHIHTTNTTKQYGTGLSVIIHHNLTKHIQKITRIEGCLIHISFAFKGNINIHLIACYFPAAINQNDNATKRKMLRYINTCISKHDYILISGDFNEHFFKPPKNGILDLLSFKGLAESFDLIHPAKTDHTWSRNNSNRRLDMNWNTPHFATHTLNAAISDNDWFETDHKLAISDYNTSSLISQTPLHILKKHRPKRTIYITQHLSPDTWEAYNQHTENLASLINDSNFSNINDFWKAIKNIIITAADTNLPKKLIHKKNQPTKTTNINNKSLRILTQLIRTCRAHQNHPSLLHTQLYSNLKNKLLQLDPHTTLPHPNWNSQ